jgi:hypothetical protein
MCGPLQNDYTLWFEDLPLENDFQGIGVFKQLIGWVQENDIKYKLFLAQVNNAAVVIALNDPVKIGGDADFVDVVFEQPDGLSEYVDKNHILGASGEGFDSDVSASGKTIQENRFPYLILEYIEKREFDLGSGWPYPRI